MGKKKRLARNNNVKTRQKQLPVTAGGKAGVGANPERREKKPKKKRNVDSNPGLNKGLFSRIKQEYFDYDYLDKLSDKDKLFLGQFTEEFLGANLEEKKNKKYNKKRNLHPKKYRKPIFDANNARNRDTLSNARAGGFLDYEESLISSLEDITEDDIIDQIEICRDVEKFYSENELEQEDLPKFVDES